MKNPISLKKNSEFKFVYENGKSYANKYLVMYVAAYSIGEDTRIGISVSKKVGNSVIRHRITRLIRESYRVNKDKFNSGLNLVIVARVNAKERSYKEIESALLHLGKMHGIVEGK